MLFVIYTVQPDDRLHGLEGLARWFYGVADRWIDLYRYNQHIIGENPIELWPGQQLLIPCDSHSELFEPRVRLYTVQPSDYREGLSGIARRHYGDAGCAEAIYRINRGIIGDDRQLLQAGQLLILP
jgi:nucleoid-associated protein YgaU